MRSRVLIAVLMLSASTAAFAAIQVDNTTRELPIDPGGTVWVSNAYGSVDVAGADDNKVTVTIQRISNAMEVALAVPFQPLQSIGATAP